MGNGVASFGLRAAALMLAMVPAGVAEAACAPGAVEVRGAGGVARFTVEIADDPAERAQGLMNRPAMASSAGMLFVFETPQRATFWMKDTLIPLDMIFADAAGRVTRVAANAKPLDLTGVEGGDGVRFVLEINGGLAARLGIVEGSVLRHPVIDPATAAWPCTD